MSNAAIVAFVCGLVKSWDLRRAECFGRMAAGLLRAGRLGVAAIGRRLPADTTDKHRIKAVDRFLGNSALDLSTLTASLLALAARGQRRVFVLVDWTDLHDGVHEALVAAVSFGGRALPVAWTTSKKGHYLRSRNKLETTFCLYVKSLMPSGVEMVVVADRGFGRASLLRALRRARIHFLIRIRRDVHLLDQRGRGPVRNRRVARGQIRDLPHARYGDNARVDVRCVIAFGHGTERRVPKQPWYLVTDLSPAAATAAELVGAYKLRMRIEHNFRDHKSLRFGFQLRSVRLTRAERYDRLLAIAAVALLLLVLIGAHAEAEGLHRRFKANTSTKRTHSLFTLGLALLLRLRLRRIPARFLPACFTVTLEGMG